ncbi:hypothetical protein ACWGJP_08655 [Microbacterium sp. NPDC055903]
MSGTRAITDEELPFIPGHVEHADAEEQPDTQGSTPQEAELGEDGQGDLAPEDEPDVLSADAVGADEPTDLREEAP